MKKTFTYLFVGSKGRLARHLLHYFNEAQFPVELLEWHRPLISQSDSSKSNSSKSNSSKSDKFLSSEIENQIGLQDSKSLDELICKAKQATHIWLCLPDRWIEPYYHWIQNNLRDQRPISSQSQSQIGQQNHQPIFIHSSGAWSYPGIYSAHPLMSFRTFTEKNSAYPMEVYKSIGFALTPPPREASFSEPAPAARESDSASLSLSEIKSQLFSFLPNPCFLLNERNKAFYHGLCVLAANGSVLLWQKFIQEMKGLQVSDQSAQVFIRQVFENFITDSQRALTGPLIRKDYATLEKDLKAFQEDPFEQVFKSFKELRIDLQ